VIRILHQDARCVAVDKPSGVPTHRGWADDEDALLQQVRDQVGVWVHAIHCLDRGASGVSLFALDKEAARAFSEAWSTTDQPYLSITRGHPPELHVIDAAIPQRLGRARLPSVTRT